MKQWKNRFVSLLLACALLLSVCPAVLPQVHAEEGSGTAAAAEEKQTVVYNSATCTR